MAEIAGLLGQADRRERYRGSRRRPADAWRPSSSPRPVRSPQTQANHVRALAFDLVPDELRAPIADRLVELVRAAGTHLGTGFLATGISCRRSPTRPPRRRVRPAAPPNAPSWLNMIDRGATTVWERWDGVDADGVPHESLNHYTKGAVVSFLHRYVAGLRPTSPGYRTFEVRPRPGGGITRTSERLDTRYGRIDIDWHDRGGGFELHLVVPAGTEAAVMMPNGDADVAGPGRHAFAIQRTNSTETA